MSTTRHRRGSVQRAPPLGARSGRSERDGQSATGPPATLDEEPRPPDQPFTELPGASVQDYRQALVDLEFGMFDPAARWAGAEHAARLRSERAAEFAERLQELVAEYFGPDSVDWSSPVKYGFRWVLTPVDLPPGGAPAE
ncbi:hypothetical protein [Microlunatus parietis]|uniref:Uncharacterized protein n=1 Tax=Microlunatus parietis TaxID=682979 RepID=A0A7Y9L9G9_9ACTN|nr:hypothetical protein [Microlunatus parietis]NYE68788.1 hypothetical protein [Microlunatus parietis]